MRLYKDRVAREIKSKIKKNTTYYCMYAFLGMWDLRQNRYFDPKGGVENE
ncbi:hypothetical protein [Bacillus thuringiensis]|nr:hypothetical protein [Bacillus thuringiensis]